MSESAAIENYDILKDFVERVSMQNESDMRCRFTAIKTREAARKILLKINERQSIHPNRGNTVDKS